MGADCKLCREVRFHAECVPETMEDEIERLRRENKRLSALARQHVETLHAVQDLLYDSIGS